MFTERRRHTSCTKSCCRFRNKAERHAPLKRTPSDSHAACVCLRCASVCGVRLYAACVCMRRASVCMRRASVGVRLCAACACLRRAFEVVRLCAAYVCVRPCVACISMRRACLCGARLCTACVCRRRASVYGVLYSDLLASCRCRWFYADTAFIYGRISSNLSAHTERGSSGD